MTYTFASKEKTRYKAEQDALTQAKTEGIERLRVVGAVQKQGVWMVNLEGSSLASRMMTTQRRVTHISLGELRDRLIAFEAKYGVLSPNLTDAFRDDRGILHETDDFQDWSVTWAAWRTATGSDRIGR